ncbi:TIGR02300 family protein [Roseococcus sp. YIM B11640]|uniref:TIGR02300 family protein n=1 Tax=Roseococcus sp. YIM B11640 TaxID=3133973 RepID=UPI003C7D5D2E
MAKPELGLKRTCVACGAKFYDMMKQPAICPKCGTEQPAEQPRPRRSANVVPDDKLKKRAAGPAEADTDDIELEDVEGDAVPDDADELEDEDDAIGEEIEVETDREEEG